MKKRSPVAPTPVSASTSTTSIASSNVSSNGSGDGSRAAAPQLGRFALVPPDGGYADGTLTPRSSSAVPNNNGKHSRVTATTPDITPRGPLARRSEDPWSNGHSTAKRPGPDLEEAKPFLASGKVASLIAAFQKGAVGSPPRGGDEGREGATRQHPRGGHGPVQSPPPLQLGTPGPTPTMGPDRSATALTVPAPPAVTVAPSSASAHEGGESGRVPLPDHGAGTTSDTRSDCVPSSSSGGGGGSGGGSEGSCEHDAGIYLTWRDSPPCSGPPCQQHTETDTGPAFTQHMRQRHTQDTSPTASWPYLSCLDCCRTANGGARERSLPAAATVAAKVAPRRHKPRVGGHEGTAGTQLTQRGNLISA
jgi:hypothetical protein